MSFPPLVPVIAAFDFDGTLTTKDSLLPFLVHLNGWPRTLLKMAKIAPSLIGFSLGKVERQDVKEAILTEFLSELSLATVKREAEIYSKGKLDTFLNPKMIERLKWHQDQGHQCVIVSASIDLYLIPWAIRYRLDKVISSQLEIKGDFITGRLKDQNCWGPEKVRRLLEVVGPKNTFYLYAYGDSRGDQELLELADQSFFIDV